MKIALLLSGGVDSSVALHLLKEQGHEVHAFYLKIWLEDELSFLGQCPWEEDLRYVREVCEQADVPCKIIPLQKEYFAKVVSYTIAELKAGFTPSPDIFCNQRIKFGAFLEKIDDSYDKVASGHYARVEGESPALLKISPDVVKDQTYFLAHLSQQQLQRCLFPIGAIKKHEVRELAEKYQLANRHRKDSQGICFLGKIKFSDFVKYHLGETIGPIIELETTKKLGDHKGFWYHTIGQRKGLGLGGGPWYVVKKDIEKNIVYVSHQENLTKQSQDSFVIANCHWIIPPTAQHLKTKIRHGPKFYDCTLDWQDAEKTRAIVHLNEKDQGIAAGQYAVFYENDVCLGCSKIQFNDV